MKKNSIICEKITNIVPKSISEVYTTSEKLEDNGIKSKFLNRQHIENQAFYYYLIENKYVLYLYFKNTELKYLSVYRERPQKDIICEMDLEK